MHKNTFLGGGKQYLHKIINYNKNNTALEHTETKRVRESLSQYQLTQMLPFSFSEGHD